MYFDIKKSSKNNQYYWVAKGENHEILCVSELMFSKASCRNGIRAIKQGAATAPVYDETGEVAGTIAQRRIAV